MVYEWEFKHRYVINSYDNFHSHLDIYVLINNLQCTIDSEGWNLYKIFLITM